VRFYGVTDLVPRLVRGTHHPEAIMIPRPVVTIVVLVLLVFLGADILGQYVIPGHTANPVIDGAIIALIGAIITGAKGPKPEEPPPRAAPPSDPRQEAGRHHRSEDPP